jgi:crotonobetainyl-CoA:carnitine CoA-transferase CaiB-like acyl-CoA transferase
MMNRNKRDIVLDLKTKGGAEILRRLIGKADVLVENFGPGVMDRLGFGYEAVHKEYFKLIIARSRASAAPVHIGTGAGSISLPRQ